MSTALAVSPVRDDADCTSDDNALMVLVAIQQQLATITSVKEAKGMADRADVLLHYAKRAKMGLFVQNRCTYIRLLAERRAGELVEQMEKHKGRPAKASLVERLSDHGINYNESYRWRQLLPLSPEELEGMWKDYDERHDELTRAAVMREMRTLIGPEAYRAVTQPHHPGPSAATTATNRLLAEIGGFAARLDGGALHADMTLVLAERDSLATRQVDDDLHRAILDGSRRSGLEKILNALIECRQRIDGCIAALEQDLNGAPVTCGKPG